ncbi:NAD(+) diphosphatase [Sphingomonas qomolangmaensis]|uniref:NAD(+) diphosphatase n=1 Tax=Sphingomonas qomolangmaensis TaxID=2918765 RepID=A0ABY5L889_9SPHN|nr:NAD(+) diphosphatase [Sphingomonas qomolangmaensis]UUL81813.1 NAD(+) diphosphatase [Sphingomonas qomolangmaensis]
MNPPGFTGATIDRADRLRGDAEALAAAIRDPRARLLVLDGLNPVVEHDRLVWRTLADAPAGGELLLLGLIDGVPHFAALAPDAPASGPRPPELFALLGVLPREEMALYAAARSLVDWHVRHRCCAVCGTGTASIKGGWARSCPECGAQHFPRTDPVVIMLTECRGRVLLARGSGWPAGRYSGLAGFVEPGESIEEAVARETLEEAGVRVRDVRYVASQPWPFPSSLMIACTAVADDDSLTLDRAELEDAFWATRDEVAAAMAGVEGARFVAPPRYAIAHTLLEAWLEEDSRGRG